MATSSKTGEAQGEQGNDLPPATSNPVQPIILSPEDVCPFLKAAARDNTRKRRKSGKSTLIRQ